MNSKNTHFINNNLCQPLCGDCILFIICILHVLFEKRTCVLLDKLAGASHAHQGFTEGQCVSLSGRLEVFLLLYNEVC